MTESTQQWATLLASSIAALAAIASAVLAAIGAAKARRWTGRDHWWQRFVWAMSTAASSERTDRDAAIEILADLTCVAWGQRDDNELAMRVREHFIRDNENPPPPSEPSRRWWSR